jgi:aspartate aminotransferase
MDPRLSAHYARRQPSVVRLAQIEFARRSDPTEAINVAIGNVSLPMHPAMIARLRELGHPGGGFADGVVQYTPTVGLTETIQAFLNIIAASGCDTAGLHGQITDGGSQAMELAVLGVTGPAGSDEAPLLLIDAAYPNYTSFARRLGRRTVSVTRQLGDDGRFSLPDLAEIEQVIREHRPGGMVVIPYDNPTGQLYTRPQLEDLARLCVEYGMWLISDEAYRELHYQDQETTSVWALTETAVPGITGRRIGIETSSKVWNACGLRIGALITDNADLHRQAVAENTASLCANHIGQWIFGALAHESHADLRAWYERQRAYYREMLTALAEETRRLLPGVIVSSPDATIYSVIDLRRITDESFSALDFAIWCAREGSCLVDGRRLTLLVAPMAGFYSTPEGEPNPGRTQMRIAYIERPENMRLVPQLLAELLDQYRERG